MNNIEHHEEHSHSYKHHTFRKLGFSLFITVLAMMMEIAGGWISGSIALISDAGHMLTHAFAIGISMFGIWIARKPVCCHRTYGLMRAEVLAAFVNGLFLGLVSFWIIAESVERFFYPQPIMSLQMLIIAIIGLAVNIISIWLLEGSHHHDLNVRSVFLHMIGDAVSSVAIIFAALIIKVTNWIWLDPAISVFIAVWILVWAKDLLLESARVLLEMAPKGKDSKEVADGLKRQFPMIDETHKAHFWTITEDFSIFTARLRLSNKRQSIQELSFLREEMESWLRAEYGIREITLQLE